ncbi:MAG: site-2 protease family protein [Chloroflexi bacterium]|nr:site-2 protease family protein [Chloroflexota bacterium]
MTLITAAALVVAITGHEFAHALIATQLGDPTAKRLGRLSLNPLVHLDPLGTLMLFLAGFGWGKPVPVNPYHLKNGHKEGMAVVGLAGPMANLATAGLLGLLIKTELVAWRFPSLLSYRLSSGWDGEILLANVVTLAIFYSIILAVFNLIPVAPLDGYNVAVGLLPGNLSRSLARTAHYGPMILMMVIAFGWFTGFSIIWDILRPIINVLSLLLAGRTF